MSKTTWENTVVSPCSTFHLLKGKPFYHQRYSQVLKFHKPGLAPVKDNTQAFHINIQGAPAYPYRFIETFGFYDNLAAVRDDEGWFHVTPRGEAVYPERYGWCGNFQEGSCPVKDQDGNYFHINSEGRRRYSSNYCYVGDFKDGAAVVCNKNGLHTHIDPEGHPIHDCYFKDLDVYHKGFARAQDEQGWFHVNNKGKAIYNERYANVEPFYNGFARVETTDGALLTINEQAEITQVLREGQKKPWQSLSSDLVGFWSTETIATAVKLKILEELPNSTTQIANHRKLRYESTLRLLKALWELNIVNYHENVWEITEKGRLLLKRDTTFMGEASIMWSDVNGENWKSLPSYLQSDMPHHRPVFKAFASDEKLKCYHKAIDGYALEDFDFISNAPINWENHKKIIAVGRTAKVILEKLLEKYSHLTGVLLGEDYVLKHASFVPSVLERCQLKSQNILDAWDETADIILLPKVLHYWPDQEAKQLLFQAKKALKNEGTLYILEMLLSETHPRGALLDLNMLAESGGKLRSLADWKELFEQTALKLNENIPLAPWLNLLVVHSLNR